MKHFCYVTGVYGRRDPLIVERQGWSLQKAGFHVSYIVCDNLPSEQYNGIDIISTGFAPKGRLERFINTKKYIYDAAIKQDADFYQVSDPELISLGRKLKRKGKKVIFNLREYYPDLILKKFYMPRILRKVMSHYYNFCIEHYLNDYDAVFTITPEIVDLLKRRHNIKNVYLLTNYPIPNEDYILSKDDYLQRPNMLFYEGTIYSISRQEKVLDALSMLEGIKYLLVGRIEDSYENIKKHPYWKYVEFHDGFNKKELKVFFERATICNTLRDFGVMDGSLGVIKLFESMEAALPVLLSDVPLYRDLVSKYNCGLCVNPNNTEAIRKAIKYLIDNKEEAYQMGQNGRNAVLKEFNWHKQAEKYIRIICEMNNCD